LILTLEVPHVGRPSCWFAFNEEDFIRKVRLGRPAAAAAVIFNVSTPRQLLEPAERGPDATERSLRDAEWRALAAAHGTDAAVYRADYLLAAAHYQAEAVSEFVAHVAAVAHGLKACRVYYDEEQAMDALLQDSLYAGEDGFYAHMALREQLIALEVLADDL
jgi:hypothetical protein